MEEVFVNEHSVLRYTAVDSIIHDSLNCAVIKKKKKNRTSFTQSLFYSIPS